MVTLIIENELFDGILELYLFVISSFISKKNMAYFCSRISSSNTYAIPLELYFNVLTRGKQ